MFEQLPLIYVFGPAIIIASIAFFIYKIQINKKELSALGKAIGFFQFTSIVFGSLVIILWFLMPQTASLSTFGYPTDLSSINDEAKILQYFQKYNLAIVRTADVVKWFIFLFIWWFLTSLYGLSSVLKEDKIKTVA